MDEAKLGKTGIGTMMGRPVELPSGLEDCALEALVSKLLWPTEDVAGAVGLPEKSDEGVEKGDPVKLEGFPEVSGPLTVLGQGSDKPLEVLIVGTPPVEVLDTGKLGDEVASAEEPELGDEPTEDC